MHGDVKKQKGYPMPLMTGGHWLVLVLILLIAFLPIGTIWMGLSCDEGKLDFYDWIFSLVVPFYGPAVVIFTC